LCISLDYIYNIKLVTFYTPASNFYVIVARRIVILMHFLWT
jgi:hypothetical protein